MSCVFGVKWKHGESKRGARNPVFFFAVVYLRDFFIICTNIENYLKNPFNHLSEASQKLVS